VDVIAYNSKVFYVITQGAGLGDNVRRVPITGKRDGAGRLERGQRSVAGIQHDGVIARPAPGGFGCQQILPVAYGGDRQGGSAATNYQVMPGDRVFYRRGQRGLVQQLPDEGDGAGREAVRHRWAGHFHIRSMPDHGPQLQFDAKRSLTQTTLCGIAAFGCATGKSTTKEVMPWCVLLSC